MRDDLVAVGSGKGSAQSGGPLIWKPSGRGSGGAASAMYTGTTIDETPTPKPSSSGGRPRAPQ